jgi:hypothetical protein
MEEGEEVRKHKLERLKEALARADGDIVAGKGTILTDEKDIDALFVAIRS